MQLQRKSLYIIRIYADLIFLIISFFLAFAISVSGKIGRFDQSQIFLLISLTIVLIFSSKTTGLYDEFRSRNFSFELVALIKNVFIQALTSIIVLFLLKEERISRQFVIYYSFSLIIFLGFEKYIFRQMLNYFRKKGKNLRNILIVGAGRVGERFYETIKGNPHFGYKLVGFLDEEKKPFLNGKYLGKIEELENILNTRPVDDVIIALPNSATETIEQVVNTCERYTTRIKIIPDYFKFVSQKYSVSMFGRFPVVSVREDQLNQIHWRFLKRTFDITVTSFVFIFIFSWLWPIIVILQKIFNPGPLFYKALRWGRNGEEFVCYKFRTMIPQSNNIDQNGNHKHSSKNDPRITKFGGILRKTNLDELPQFINVLKGEMSIVGPRPHDVQENLEIKDRIRSYMWRHVGKPGLTGWAQVNGYRGGTKDISLMRKRTEYDIWYIENWSFLLDIQIIFLTVWKMIKGDPNAY